MLLINIFLLVCGFFIPPAAIILMTSPFCCRLLWRQASIPWGSA